MAKHVFLIATLLFASFLLNAQTTMWTLHVPYYGAQYLYLDDRYVPSDSLCAINLQVIYHYSSVIDTIEKTKTGERMQLEVGRNLSKFSSYERFMMDSLLSHSPHPNVPEIAVHVLSRKRVSPEFFETVYLNYPTGQLTVSGRLVAADFIYEEPMPVFNWTITDTTGVWCGYTTIKAVCHFRGRDYEAWFAPDIPVSRGPWKFYGLPGLILIVKDSEGLFSYEALTVNNHNTGFIGKPRYAYSETDRDAYVKAKKNIIANYPLYQKYYNNGTGIIVSPRPEYKAKALRYDLIEKSD